MLVFLLRTYACCVGSYANVMCWSVTYKHVCSFHSTLSTLNGHQPTNELLATKHESLLLIYSLMYFPLLVGVLCLSLICCALHALLYVQSSFAIILKRKRKLVALLLLSYNCLATVNVLWLFLMVPWLGLRCVIVVFPDHTHLFFVCFYS